jgi:hypothetical protein
MARLGRRRRERTKMVEGSLNHEVEVEAGRTCTMA